MTTELILCPETANLCLLLGKAFSSPREFDPGHAQACRELVAGLPPDLVGGGLALAEEWGRVISEVEPALLAYARLFVGPFEIQAPPYASHYLEPDQRLMGEVSMWVAGVYADADLGPADGPSEAPDHVALELEFLYYLGFQANTFGTPEWSGRASAFIDKHMMLWIPRLAEAMLDPDPHPFYRALANFVPPYLRHVGGRLRCGEKRD